MKFQAIIFVVIIVLFSGLSADAAKSKAKPQTKASEFGPVEYIEPVSGTIFHFNEGILNDTSRLDYRKALVQTPKTWISVWSMPSQDKKTFAWAKINEFDANNRFGSMTYQVKLENFDGWMRYYELTVKGVTTYYNVALIRGNAFALYLTESAVSTDDFTLSELLSKTQLGQIGGRVDNDGRLTSAFWILVVAAALLSGIAKLIFYDKRNEYLGMLICGGIVIALLFVILYWIMFYFVGTSLLWTLIVACIWVVVGLSRSWVDFFNFINKMFSS